MGLQDGLVDDGTDDLSFVPNGGTELMGVADKRMIWIKTQSMRRNLYLTLLR